MGNRLTSLGLSLLVVIYAGVLVYESHVYRQWNVEVKEQARLQANIMQARAIGTVAQRLVHRMADESQTDTAIAEVLKKNGIRLAVNAPEAAIATPSAPPDRTPAPTP